MAAAAARARQPAFGSALRACALGINPLLAGLKHLNRLEQVLAQMQRDDGSGLDEVLMLSTRRPGDRWQHVECVPCR